MNSSHLAAPPSIHLNNKMPADLPPHFRSRLGNGPATTNGATTTALLTPSSTSSAFSSSSALSSPSSSSSSSYTSPSTSLTTNNNSKNNTITPTNKFAPARRLAARQTLRLAIPKQQGDSYALQNACNGQLAGSSNAPAGQYHSNSFYRHSPSQLPPAPILKRTQTPATAHSFGGTAFGSARSSVSPLESHLLSSASHLSSGTTPATSSVHFSGSSSTATPSTGSKFLNLRKPSITLSSADARNNNNTSDLFAFAQEMSPDNSPIFADLASSISPASSSGSPSNHLTRLFNMSPSIRYSNMSDFSDNSSHSGVVSPAASLIENFHKKTGSTLSGIGGGGGGGGGSGGSSSNSLGSGNSTPTPTSTLLSNGIGSSNGLMAGGSGLGTSSNGGTQLSASSLGRQNLINTSSSLSSSLKETSSTSQQVVNSSSTTTRVEKKSQRLHHVTSSTSTSSSQTSSSSSSSSSSEMKTAALKRDLSEIKNSMSEINDLALGRTATNTTSAVSSHQPCINDLSSLNALNSADAINQLKKKIRSSIENLVDGDAEPMVTFPDGDDEHDLSNCMDLVNSTGKGHHQLTANGLSGSSKTIDTVKFEEKRTKTESKTKVVTDGFSSEQATSNLAEMKRLQAGDIDYKEAKAASAMRNRLEMDGVKTEENAAVIQEALSLRAGDVTQQASNNVAAASIKVQSDTFSADKKAISQSQQSQTMTSNGIISQEKHVSSASQSNYTMTHKGVSSSGSSMISSSSQMSATNGHLLKLADLKLDDLKALNSSSGPREIEQAISKYSNVLSTFVNTLQDTKTVSDKSLYLNKINEVIRRAWAVPTHGHELGNSLCNSLRQSGGLDLLMKNCVQSDKAIQFHSAQLLEQCLTTENRTHVVDYGLDKVVNVACVCTKNTDPKDIDMRITDMNAYSRVGTGILEHLFKHSEGTCSDVIKLGGLDAVLFECRKNDVETLRHCASALANLSLYGGAENQEAMIYRKVPMWLFPLALNDDDNIKYYACLAIAVLVANKEIEAEVLKSGTLDLVEPFVTSHDPSQFAKSNLAHAHGQSKHWLQRLVPVLSSNREEARNLAAFHFCMEAGIKREQGNTEIFREIGAIEALKTVASCPNAIASKFAAQALRLIGETVPHKLSQQVPLWSVEDVQEWVKQIGFAQFEKQFADSQVDGDLLLKLNEENLRDDIGISNGILLKRFERELLNLKKMADYSSKDSAKMHLFLAEIGPEYCSYTYSMLHAGIDKISLPQLNEDMLIAECGIKNSIHRLRILNAVKNLENSLPSSSEENMAKTLDVFVSYRRSNGSQLASLLKVHLQLRGFSVFIDVERLEAGKFDNGLLNSIRQAKNFILVLTPNALQRCVDDDEGKDWVHREIVAALNSNCNIIPIIDQQFNWPETEKLPEDMRSVCHFNGVTWIHDYQDACIDKLERFMRGEKNIDRIMGMAPSTPGSASVSYQRMHSNDSDYQSSAGGGGSGVGGGGSSVVGSGGVSSTAGSVSCDVSTSNGGGQANHQANRYRQSSSPARQRIGGGGGGGSIGGGSSLGGSGLLASNGYGRGSKRNLLPPYRTQPLPHKTIPIGGSMQNVSPLAYRPPRRSSAVGIYSGSKRGNATNLRSHSVDGLLDGSSSTDDHEEQRIAEAAALVTAGSMALTNGSAAMHDSTHTLRASNENSQNGSHDSLAKLNESIGESIGGGGGDGGVTVARRDKTNLTANPSQHRKSRSLDHFLDEQTLQEIVATIEPTDGTQSMQNLATPITPILNRGVLTKFSQRATSQRDSKSITPERVGLRHNAVTRQSPEGVSSTEDEHEDAQSTNSVPNVPIDQTRGHSNRGSVRSNNSASHLQQPHNHNTTSSSSLGSTNANPNNKTLFNRTLKKVRSLIKKP